jgi:hypothetical protein
VGGWLVKDLTDVQRRIFHAPIGDLDLRRRPKPDRVREAGQCTCPAGPWCQGPASLDWLDCLGDLLKVIPADQAALVHHCLMWGGWLVELPPEAEK